MTENDSKCTQCGHEFHFNKIIIGDPYCPKCKGRAERLPQKPPLQVLQEASEKIQDALMAVYSEDASGAELMGYLVALTCEATFFGNMLQSMGTEIESIIELQQMGQKMGIEGFQKLTQEVVVQQKVEAFDPGSRIGVKPKGLVKS